MRTIGNGSEGTAVRVLQLLLCGCGYAVECSGFYDDSTESAVADVQRQGGLPVTGRCDGRTWDALCDVAQDYMA